MPSVEGSAAEVLPAWIVWTRWALLPVAGYLVTRLLARPLARLTAKPPQDPSGTTWPDNALALWRVRGVPFVAALLCGVFLYVLAFARGASSAGSDSAVLPLVFAALLVAAGDEKRGLMKRYAGVALSRRSAWTSRISMALLWRGLGMVAALLFLVARPDPPNAMRVVLAAGVVLLVVLWCNGGLWIARGLGLARPAGERLRAAVALAAARGGVRAPRAFEIDAWMTNALALPVLGHVVVTPRAIERLDDEELTAVVAHELGHLQERGRFVLVGLPSLACALFLVAGRVAGLGIVALACGLSVFVLAMLLVPRWMRAAESRADAFVHASVPDPTVLARALEILHREGLVPPSAGRRATHPDLAQRQVAAGASASAQAVAAPKERRADLAFFLVAIPVVLAAVSGRSLLERPADSSGAARLALAVLGPEPRQLYSLARLEWAAGRDREAARLFRGGSLLEPEAPLWPVCEGLVFSESGDCSAARARLVEAERRLVLRPDPDLEPHVERLRDAVAGCP